MVVNKMQEQLFPESIITTKFCHIFSYTQLLIVFDYLKIYVERSFIDSNDNYLIQSFMAYVIESYQDHVILLLFDIGRNKHTNHS